MRGVLSPQSPFRPCLVAENVNKGGQLGPVVPVGFFDMGIELRPSYLFLKSFWRELVLVPPAVAWIQTGYLGPDPKCIEIHRTFSGGFDGFWIRVECCF